MSDFTSGFWSIFVAVIALVSVAGCGVFLKIQSTKRPALKAGEQADLHDHVWDGDLQEYNNPLPRWWMWLFYITIFFSLGYLIYFPGLGSFGGTGQWSSEGEYQAEVAKAEGEFGPLFAQYAKTDLAILAKDTKANAMGQRLFLTYCAQCHGSDAGGAVGFPNLRDKDWIYGSAPETIKETIANGRMGVMPPWGAVLGDEGVKDMAHYVMSLNGRVFDSLRAARGKEKFITTCVACHGAEGKGNPAIGAENLTLTLLHGADEPALIETISKGRIDIMPAQKELLGEAKVHLLAAYVYSLGGGEPPLPAPVAKPAPAPAAAAPAKSK
jgi:cytochrome c oxidase cbb3-type subunit III